MARPLLIASLVALTASLAHAQGDAGAPDGDPGAPAQAGSEDDAFGDDAFGDDAFGDAEEIETVEEVEPAETEAERNPFLNLVGYFHSALVHMPIAWLFLLVALDVWTLLLRKPGFEKAGPVLLVLTLASFAPAVGSGLARFSVLPDDPSITESALDHRNIMFAAAAMLVVAGVLRWRGLGGTSRLAYLGFVIVALALVGWGAHIGGEMVYGEIPW